MTIQPWVRRAVIAAAGFMPSLVAAQDASLADTLGKPGKFFRTEVPTALTLTMNVGAVRRDKGADAPWRWGSLSYAAPDGSQKELPIQVKTRGIWRLKNCQFPPLRLNFSKGSKKDTPFEGLDKPKLVNFCKDTDAHDRFILQEYQLYRVYRLISPYGHFARLVKVTYLDSAKRNQHAIRYGIMLEEPEGIAERTHGKIVKQKGAGPGDIDGYQHALVGLFEYMIGNTDWSISGLHNIELLMLPNGDLITIPFDFDYAGVVNTYYAVPDPMLAITTVRERLYRGYCSTEKDMARAVAQFKAMRPAITALYRDSIGTLLPSGTINETLRYFDDFFETINDSRRFRRQIVESCIGPKIPEESPR